MIKREAIMVGFYHWNYDMMDINMGKEKTKGLVDADCLHWTPCRSSGSSDPMMRE